MNRRRFLLSAAAFAAAPSAAFDGRSVTLNGREHVLSDIIAPSTTLSSSREPASEFAAAALLEIIRNGAPLPPISAKNDRWGRAEGAIHWRASDGRMTTLQEMMLSQGAARVAPETDDFDFIERCFVAEKAARSARLGLWRFDAYRVRSAENAEWSRGYQIYAGSILTAAERQSRIFLNFGDDFRNDFTATVAKGAFRRWKNRTDLQSVVGMRVEIRGPVERINGPSIELLHEMQLRMA